MQRRRARRGSRSRRRRTTSMNSCWREPAAALLVQRAVARLLHGDEHHAGVDLAAAEAADEAEVALHLAARAQELLDLPEARASVASRLVPTGVWKRIRKRLVSWAGTNSWRSSRTMQQRERRRTTSAPGQHPAAVVQRGHQRALVARRPAASKARSTAWPEPAAPLAHLEEARAAHGRQGQRLEQRDEHRHRDRDAELEEELADDALHEGDGQEDGDDGGGGGGGGEGDLARAHRGRLDLALAVLAVAVDVLEHHDRVVHHDADDQRQPEHGEGVQREAEEVHHDERAEDRGGDGQQHVERRGPRAEEQPAHEAGEQRGQHQGEQDLVDRVLRRRRCCRS